MKKLTLNTKLICILVMIATVLCTFTGCEEALEYILSEEVVTEECYNDIDENYVDEDMTEQSETSETTVETISETITPESSIPEYPGKQMWRQTRQMQSRRIHTSQYPETETVTESSVEKLSVEKDGRYTTPEDVAEYIHTFGTLPSNFITKKEAQKLGWDNKKGNLWDVTDQMSIGGDYFGNYEGLLPEEDGRKYTECDVNYEGGYRGSERIVFSNDGLIFYTNDHYESFTLLYGEE